MKIVGIAFGVAVIGIIIAFIYEIKFTYTLIPQHYSLILFISA